MHAVPVRVDAVADQPVRRRRLAPLLEELPRRAVAGGVLRRHRADQAGVLKEGFQIAAGGRYEPCQADEQRQTINWRKISIECVC